jgi:hypothetical protein
MYTLALVLCIPSTEYHLVLVLSTSQHKSSMQVIIRRAAVRSPERLNLSLMWEGLEVCIHCWENIACISCNEKIACIRTGNTIIYGHTCYVRVTTSDLYNLLSVPKLT